MKLSKIRAITIISIVILVLLFSCQPSTTLVKEQSSWRMISVPSINDAAASFETPPSTYGPIHWEIWGGQQTREQIVTDIEQVHANGGAVYMINNSRGMRPRYFTPEYLDLVKLVVGECKKRSMKVWHEGDAG